MKVYSDLRLLQDHLSASFNKSQGWVLALGNFDGFHRGHQQLWAELKTASNNFELPTALVTFEPHPKQILSPHIPWKRIWGPWDLQNFLSPSALTALVQQKFDTGFSSISAEEFVEKWLAPLRPKALVVGHDFSFGHRRNGNIEMLSGFCKKNNVSINPVEAFSWAGERISTTQIKGLLSQGLLVESRELLNHDVTLGGEVVHGRKLGRTIGIPTANIELQIQPALALGVYAVTITHSSAKNEVKPILEVDQRHDQDILKSSMLAQQKKWKGVANVGLAPTVSQELKAKLEVHIFDFSGDLYGQDLNVTFESYLRPEKKFSSVDELKEQIQKDIQEARKVMS